MAGTLEVDLRFVADEPNAEMFESFLDAVMDEFDNLGLEADYLASARDLTATWSITIADASDDSFMAALSSLRTALHAAGCVTAGWPATHSIVATRNLASA